VGPVNRLGVWQGEIWNRRKNGEHFLEWLSINTVKDKNGKVVNYVGMFSDITKVRESQQRIEYLATHDELTGLPNRALFNDRLHLALARAERSRESIGVVFIDLDNFKVVNDTLGHVTGDKLLKQAALRCSTACAPKTPWPAWAATSSWSCSKPPIAARRH
jgi:two-component system CheB/CheR fusion protein